MSKKMNLQLFAGFDDLDPDAQLFRSQSDGGDEDNLVLNLAGVSEDRPALEALPPGIYDAIVENTEFGSSSNGNPMITWIFRVTDPRYEGRLLFFHTVLNSEVGQSRLKRTLLRVCPDIDLTEFRPKKFCDEGVALGLPCRVKVRVRPYQGRKSNNVVDVLPPQAEGGTFLDQGL